MTPGDALVDYPMVMVSLVRIHVSLCILANDSHDGQATIRHETGTGELRALGFLTHHLGPVRSRQAPFRVT